MNKILYSSYYHSQAKYQLNICSLQENIITDICIIGAGFTGINTAIELANLGLSCVVLEAQDLGFGASGHNGGQLIRGLGHNLSKFTPLIGVEAVKTLEILGIHSIELVKNRIKQFNIKCDFVTGYCDLANHPKNYADFQNELEHLTSLNYQHTLKLIPQADMMQIVGSSNYYGGLLDMGSGHLSPLNLLLGEAQAAQSMGVQIFTNSKVTNINYADKITVQTAQGTVITDKLVFACNAYIDGLNNYLDSKILPAGSYIIVTEVLDDALLHKMIPQNLALCDQKIALDYFRLTADNRLLFGGACHYSGRDPHDIKAYMRKKMLKVFPYLSDINIDFSWGKMIGIGANRLPQIGRLANHPNVYYAQGYAGHGLNTTHLAATLLANEISGKSSEFAIFDKVPHISFPGGKYLRSYLLALGMCWQQIKQQINNCL